MSRGNSLWCVVGLPVCMLALLVLLTPIEVASADECVKHCRAQHNSCRMSAKLLSSSHCDAQLQACISSCVRR